MSFLVLLVLDGSRSHTLSGSAASASLPWTRPEQEAARLPKTGFSDPPDNGGAAGGRAVAEQMADRRQAVALSRGLLEERAGRWANRKRLCINGKCPAVEGEIDNINANAQGQDSPTVRWNDNAATRKNKLLPEAPPSPPANTPGAVAGRVRCSKYAHGCPLFLYQHPKLPPTQSSYSSPTHHRHPSFHPNPIICAALPSYRIASHQTVNALLTRPWVPGLLSSRYVQSRKGAQEIKLTPWYRPGRSHVCVHVPFNPKLSG